MGRMITVSTTPVTSGTVEKDDQGYYLVNLGGFNVFNQSGAFYLVTDVNQLLFGERNGKPNPFLHRLKSGYLTGEANHPEKLPGMSNMEYYSRMVRLDVSRTAFHIKEVLVDIEEDKAPLLQGAGHPIKIRGWIKPSGKYGEILRESLENPNQNTAFSIRVISQDEIRNGIAIRRPIQVVTWDWVDTPGIANCNKFSTIKGSSVVGEAFTFNLEPINNTWDLPEVVGMEDNGAKELHKFVLDYVNDSNKVTDDYISKW